MTPTREGDTLRSGLKVGLNYFRLDCQLDDKFELIEAEFGLTGFAVVVKLFQRIYGGEGYYCEWNKEVALVFGYRNKAGANVVSEIVEAAVRRGLFDKGKFEKYHILTSAGIQKWYFGAVGRRGLVEVKKEYLLVDVDILPDNARIIDHSASKMSDSASGMRHRRVKESKGEESTAEDSNAAYAACPEQPDDGRSVPTKSNKPTPSDFDIPLNDGTVYNVPSENIEVYRRLYPSVDVEQELRNMIGWSMSNPKQRKTSTGVKSFITRWLKREQDKAGNKGGVRNANDRRINSQPARKLYEGETVV